MLNRVSNGLNVITSHVVEMVYTFETLFQTTLLSNICSTCACVLQLLLWVGSYIPHTLGVAFGVFGIDLVKKERKKERNKERKERPHGRELRKLISPYGVSFLIGMYQALMVSI
jgi:hypothetical protein